MGRREGCFFEGPQFVSRVWHAHGVSTFETIPGDEQSPVILHVPHAATAIPDNVRRGIVLTDDEFAAELVAMTDADTDLIATGAADLATVRPWTFTNQLSRLVVDPERFPDAREEMNASGMGAVYERTSTGSSLRTLTSFDRDALIAEYFTPYAEGIAALVRDRLIACGRVTIIDVHSYPKESLPYELHADGPRPQICIGTDEFHTPGALVDAAVSGFSRVVSAAEIRLNSPFGGCYVPLDQHKQNREVHALMLEIRRDVVASRLNDLVASMAALVNALPLP